MGYVNVSPDKTEALGFFDAGVMAAALHGIADTTNRRLIAVAADRAAPDCPLGERPGWGEVVASISDWDVLLMMSPDSISPRADVVEAVRAVLAERGRRLEWPGMATRQQPGPPR
jgi:hypothetical protein